MVRQGTERFFIVSLGSHMFNRVPKELLGVPTGSICMGFYWVPQGSMSFPKGAIRCLRVP